MWCHFFGKAMDCGSAINVRFESDRQGFFCENNFLVSNKIAFEKALFVELFDCIGLHEISEFEDFCLATIRIPHNDN